MQQQNEKLVYVVGQRFAGFSVHENIRTLSELVAEIQLGHHDGPGTNLEVRGGQGMSTYEWQYLEDAVERRGIHDRVRIRPSRLDPARRAEAHKHREQNVLIADLGRRDDQLFQAALLLNADNELLLDHQTGQHVQGMVVVEAARQMFLAVTERYYTHRWPGRRYYFVIDSISTTFENFLFPLDAEILYLVQSADLDDPERLGFTARIDLHQAGRRAASTEVSFTAFDTARLKRVEHRRADRAVEYAVQSSSGALASAGAR
ncbi:AfsA-related hotdog domain-containing protein [Nocardiopsis terrae]